MGLEISVSEKGKKFQYLQHNAAIKACVSDHFTDNGPFKCRVANVCKTSRDNFCTHFKFPFCSLHSWKLKPRFSCGCQARHYYRLEFVSHEQFLLKSRKMSILPTNTRNSVFVSFSTYWPFRLKCLIWWFYKYPS